eukprot:Gb_04078 [translate_table: standard]
MGTGWRRARNALGLTVCTSIPKELDDQPSESLDSAGPSFEAGTDGGLRLQIPEIVGNHGRVRLQTVVSPRAHSQGSPRTQVQSPRIIGSSPRLRNAENVSPSETMSKCSVPSSPRSPSKLNLLRNGIRTLRSTCPICLETMKPGHGHAIFTAECSHAFHFPCIASNVRHGNLVCPVCRAKWKEVPWQAPVKQENNPAATTPRTRNGNLNSRRHNAREEEALRNAEEEQRRLDPVLRILDDSIASFRGHRQSYSQEPTVYDDDEPLEANLTREQTPDDQELEFKNLAADPEGTSYNQSQIRKMEVTLHPEVESVAAGKTCENFTVLVHVKAPSASACFKQQDQQGLNGSGNSVLDPSGRAPIDLVTVLDVSGSMSGTKLALLKGAMSFVISNLSPADRLAVVAFSSTAKRVFPLKRMVPDGQRAARRVIERLLCTGGTNIAEGLRKGAKVLEERRERNPVASIMLLSDGQDTYSLSSRGVISFNPHTTSSARCASRQGSRYGHIQIPVHAFGFGIDHDAATMHTISEESGGTFSFIQAEGLVQDAFAQCIGGLLSVVVQDVLLTVSCNSVQIPGLELKSFHAGSYETFINGSSGTVKLGDLYAEEERNILVELKLPAVKSGNAMTIVSVQCSFKDPVSQQTLQVREQHLAISRPEGSLDESLGVNIEVEKQRNRLRTAQAIANARTLADRGDMSGAQKVLQTAKVELQSSTVSRTGDLSVSIALEAEITEIQARMTNKQTYERSGRAFVLSAQSSHLRQRATTRGESIENYSREYQTPSMADMVMRSQTLSATEPNTTNSGITQQPMTPTSAWRTAERLAKVATLKKSCTRVTDLHGFENGGF